MKKLFTLIFAGLITFNLVACTSNDSDSAKTNSNSASQSSTSSNSYPSKITSFSSTDINGEKVTEEIFKNKKYTVINFWGTYCSPCINEMPDLQTWNETLGDDAQLIGVLVDVSDVSEDTNETAINIVEKTGVKFKNIIPSGGLTNFVSKLVGVPTTIVVDSEGNRIGEPVVGSQINSYKELLNNALKNNE